MVGIIREDSCLFVVPFFGGVRGGADFVVESYCVTRVYWGHGKFPIAYCFDVSLGFGGSVRLRGGRFFVGARRFREFRLD